MNLPRLHRPDQPPPPEDAIATKPSWLSVARRLASEELTLVGGGSIYTESLVSLFWVLSALEMDDLPHPLIEAVQGGAFLAAFEGRCGSGVCIVARGRDVEVSARMGLAPCTVALLPRDGRGEVVRPEPSSGAVSLARTALGWLTGSWGEPECELLRVASLKGRKIG